jgi:Right handed beta helix region
VAGDRDVLVTATGGGPVRLPRVTIAGGVGGLAFDGLTLTGSGAGPTFAIGPGAHDVRLADSRVSARGQEAVELAAGSHDIVVEGSRIHTEEGGSGVIMNSESDLPGAPAEVEPTAPISRVVLRGNHFDGIAIDAIRPANFRDLLVEGNEIEGVYETGAHNDALQVVWGGRGLVFRDNLVHGNTGQGFFIKDGRVHDVTIANNAFVQNTRRKPGDQPAASPLQLYDVVGVRIVGNTIWDNDNAVLLRTGLRDVTIENNVIENLVADEGSVDALRRAVRQDWNLMSGGWNWGREGAIGPHDVAAFEQPDRQPRFVDADGLDYRLAPGSPGIDAGTAAHRPGGRGACTRAWDDPAVPDSGDATPAVDMGWRERRPGC